MSVYKLELKRKKISGETINISGPEVVYKYARKNFYKEEDSWKEKCIALCLDAGRNLIGYADISSGTDTKCFIDIKQISKVAIDSMAASIIVLHNHPSGNPVPSISDINETDKLKKALSVFNIQLADHIVIGEKSYFSFILEKTINTR